MDKGPDSDNSTTAEIVNLSNYRPKIDPEHLGAEVVKIADSQQRPAHPTPEQTVANPEKLAAVYDLHARRLKENRIQEQLNDIISEIKSLPEQQDNANALLEQINKSIDDIIEDLDDRQKLRLSAQLAFGLSGCDEEVFRTMVNYPNLLHIIAIATKIPKDDHHPVHRIPRIKATGVLSRVPGEYDLENGEYTPPKQ